MKIEFTTPVNHNYHSNTRNVKINLSSRLGITSSRGRELYLHVLNWQARAHLNAVYVIINQSATLFLHIQTVFTFAEIVVVISRRLNQY